MPRGNRRARRGGARIGRPPRPDAGNWEKFYVLLKTDVAAHVRAKARETGHSLSSIIGEMTSLGIATALAREQQAAEVEHTL